MNLSPLDLDVDPAAYLAVHDLLDERTSDAALTSRELEIRSTTRGIVSREVAPRASEFDATGEFAEASVQALLGAGLGGLIFPEWLGGTADTHVAYAVAMEEIAAGCAATSLIFMTQMHAAYPILLGGTTEMQKHYIPDLLTGNSYGSLGITEPGAGSDVSDLMTTAVKTDIGWTLNGQKTFITSGDRADVIVCFATTDRNHGRGGITAFVVESGWHGVAHGQPFHKMGMHGSSTTELFFDDVEIPENNLLGEEGSGWALLMSSVVKSRISAAAQGVGIARAAYARTLSALRRLHSGDVPDEATFVLAGLRSRILQGRLLLHATARQVDLASSATPGQIGMMKQACTDLGFEAAVESTRLLGPYGDIVEFGVERCLRDAKVTQIYDGTNEIQRLLVGRDTTRAWNGVA